MPSQSDHQDCVNLNLSARVPLLRSLDFSINQGPWLLVHELDAFHEPRVYFATENNTTNSTNIYDESQSCDDAIVQNSVMLSINTFKLTALNKM